MLLRARWTARRPLRSMNRTCGTYSTNPSRPGSGGREERALPPEGGGRGGGGHHDFRRQAVHRGVLSWVLGQHWGRRVAGARGVKEWWSGDGGRAHEFDLRRKGGRSNPSYTTKSHKKEPLPPGAGPWVMASWKEWQEVSTRWVWRPRAGTGCTAWRASAIGRGQKKGRWLGARGGGGPRTAGAMAVRPFKWSVP